MILCWMLPGGPPNKSSSASFCNASQILQAIRAKAKAEEEASSRDANYAQQVGALRLPSDVPPRAPPPFADVQPSS